jgi:hypothetical protein
MPEDRGIAQTKWTIRRFNSYEEYHLWLQGRMQPYSVSEINHNLLLNEGITRLQNLLTGGGGTNYGNAAAWLGVGNNSGTAAATDTGLSGTSDCYRPMEATYPQIANQTTTWRSVFASADGNFDWLEFTVANGSGNSSENLNRRVSDQGTKVVGQTWTLDLAITWS